MKALAPINWHKYLEDQRNTRTVTLDPNDDPAFAAKVSHELRRGEKLIEFVSRCGLGRTQALTMSREEISTFVNQVEQNRAEEPAVPLPIKVQRTKTNIARPLVMVG